MKKVKNLFIDKERTKVLLVSEPLEISDLDVSQHGELTHLIEALNDKKQIYPIVAINFSSKGNVEFASGYTMDPEIQGTMEKIPEDNVLCDIVGKLLLVVRHNVAISKMCGEGIDISGDENIDTLLN